MSLMRWYPTRDVAPVSSDVLTMQREINRMFDAFFHGDWQEDAGLAQSAWSPSVDLVEREDRYVVNVDLPGVPKEDVKISLHNSVLTIRGERKSQSETKDVAYHRVERCSGSFQRSFSLPATVKSEAIEASHKDGVLTIVLPKAEEARRKEIEVTVK